eukprot:SAG11_NODE_2736_length_3028_cov_3.460567_3_plen_70_part_00
MSSDSKELLFYVLERSSTISELATIPHHTVKYYEHKILLLKMCCPVISSKTVSKIALRLVVCHTHQSWD